MAFYDHDGLRLHYEVAGNGPAVLCVHGATGTGQYEWGRLADGLCRSHRLVMPDLRGHGGSDHRAGALTPELIEADLQALVEIEDLGRPHLMGFSLGAEIALRLELRHPGTAASLVLLSPGLGTVKSGEAAQAEVPTRELLEKIWPKALRSLHADRHGPDHWIELMRELWVRHAERPLIPLEELEPLACPVLLICGTEDDPRRLRQARQFVEVNERVRLVEVPGAAHAVHKDDPERVGAVVADFLDSITAASPTETGDR